MRDLCRRCLERQTKSDVWHEGWVVAHRVFDAFNTRQIGKTYAEEQAFRSLIAVAHSKAAEIAKFSLVLLLFYGVFAWSLGRSRVTVSEIV